MIERRSGMDRRTGTVRPGMQPIAHERSRQLHEEGFTTEGDDQKYATGDLVNAGLAYERWARGQIAGLATDGRPVRPWPWIKTWWKPKDPKTALVKAGALYMAECDRLKLRIGRIAEEIAKLEAKGM